MVITQPPHVPGPCPTCGGNLVPAESVRESVTASMRARLIAWVKRHDFEYQGWMESVTLERILDFALACQAKRTTDEITDMVRSTGILDKKPPAPSVPA